MRLIHSVGILCLLAVSAQAATITGKLVATPVNGTGTDGLWNVAVYVQTDTADQFGIKGAEFAITSVGTGKVNAVQANAPNTSKVKTVFASPLTATLPPNSTGPQFSTVAPLKSDLGGDGDLDAAGMAFQDFNNFNGPFQFGTAASASKDASGFDLVATQTWQMVNPLTTDTLQLAITNATFYNFATGTEPDFASAFNTVVNGSGVQVGIAAVPEPSSFALIGLGFAGMGLIRRRLK